MEWTRVTAYRSGLTPPRAPEDGLGLPWSTADGDKRVNGRPTQSMAFTHADGTHHARLRWRYTVDGWATIERRSRAADFIAAAHRIASGLRFDGTAAVRLPVVATGLPGQLHLQAIGGMDSGANWLFSLWYAAQPRPLTGDRGDGLGVTVTPMDAEQRTLASTAATTKVDGYPARYSPPSKNGPYLDSLTVWDINGCHLSLGLSGRSIFDLFGSGGATGALPHLRVTADRSRWS